MRIGAFDRGLHRGSARGSRSTAADSGRSLDLLAWIPIRRILYYDNLRVEMHPFGQAARRPRCGHTPRGVHALVVVDLEVDSDPPKVLAIGPDRAGNLLEVIGLELADNGSPAIRAMPLRPAFREHRKATTMPEKSKTYRTKTGKVLTDAEVEALAEEVEREYDVEALKARRRGRPSMGSATAEVVPVRLDPELKAAVEDACRT